LSLIKAIKISLSTGIIIPKPICEAMQIKAGTGFKMKIQDNKIILEKIEE